MVRFKVTNKLKKVLKLYEKSRSKGLLLYEPRKIDVIIHSKINKLNES